jgi:hypothetical protein
VNARTRPFGRRWRAVTSGGEPKGDIVTNLRGSSRDRSSVDRRGVACENTLGVNSGGKI